MSKPSHLAIDNKTFTSFDYGVHWGEQMGSLEHLGFAVMSHTAQKAMLPRQRRAFERGFRTGVARKETEKVA